MKKSLLLLLLVAAGIGTYAQVAQHLPHGFRKAEVPAAYKNFSVKVPYRSNIIDNQAPVVASTPSMVTAQSVQQPVDLDSIVGYTYYDLQTNNSISNRLVLNTDGTVCAAWTFSPDAIQTSNPPYPNRGTGYAYFDGNAWSPFGGPTSRVEPLRTGFTNIVVCASGAEMVIAHTADVNQTNKISVARRPQKGTGAWTQTFPWGASSDTWPKACSGGTNDTVYVVWQGSGAGTTGSPAPTVEGQTGPIYFARSNDGGLTWEPKRIIPEIDSTQYVGFGGDSYSIHARGQVVAISYADPLTDVGLLKSYDGGDTWTKTIVQIHPLPMYHIDDLTLLPGDTIIDTLVTNAGDSKVLIDNNGMCHVWFSAYRWMDDDSTDDSYSYFPYTDGLFYWNENMASDDYVLIAQTQDYNGNDSIDFPQDESCQFPFGSYTGSLTIFPSAGIDTNGRIYLSYSAIDEAADTTFYHQAHRHVYMMTLPAPYNPNDWTYPYDIVPLYADGGSGEDQEAVFACVAPYVDATYAHVLYQRDNAPGHALWTTGTCDQINNNNQASDIVHTRVATATVGIKNDNSGDLFVTQNYPNPVENLTFFNINLKKNASVKIMVNDVIGRVIESETISQLPAGNHTLSFNTSDWRPGIYTYTVEAAGLRSTRKMIVQ